MSTAADDPMAYPLPSRQLARYELVEIRESSDTDPTYGLDGLVIVGDAAVLATERSLILRSAPLGPSLIVVDADASADAARSHSADRAAMSGRTDGFTPRVMAAVPSDAIAALEAMRRGSADTFAGRWAASGLGPLSDAIASVAASASPQRAAIALASQAVASALSGANDEAALLSSARDRLTAFASRLNERRRQWRGAILAGGAPPPDDAQLARDELDTAMRTRLAWYKLPLGRVDDVGTVLGSV